MSLPPLSRAAIPFSAAQASWFRLRRSGLVDPFDSPEAASRALVGVQAQYLQAAGLALWNRTRGLNAEGLDERLYRTRTLVKLWGLRNTLHLYASDEWPLLHGALSEKPCWFERLMQRQGVDPEEFRTAVREVGERLRGVETLGRDDVREVEEALDEAAKRSWSGILISVVRAGLACHAAPGDRNETRLAHREVWLPGLAWDPPPPEEAKLELARRYLATYGPATARDLAYWHGAPAADARRWVAALEEELVEIDLGGTPCLALRRDLPDLEESPPSPAGWPVRLLYRFDPLLLGLREKSWLIDPAHYGRVWRPAGHVEGVLLVRGRIAGTWRYDRRPKGLEVTIDPFRPLPGTVLRKLEREATGVADFFGLELSGFGPKSAGQARGHREP